MPTNVFAGGNAHYGSFRANLLKLRFNGQQMLGMMAQQIQFNFQQQISMLYELGSNAMYYVGGRAQGTGSISRIIGPAPATVAFITSLADICCPGNLTFDASNGCPAGSSGASGAAAGTTTAIASSSVNVAKPCPPPGVTAPTAVDNGAPAAGTAPGVGNGIHYILQSVVLQSIGASVSSQDIVISEQIQFMYTNLALGP